MLAFEIVIKTEKGEISKKYKNILQMSKDTKIPYHSLKTIIDRNNTKHKKHKNSAINNLMDKIKIYKISEFSDFSALTE